MKLFAYRDEIYNDCYDLTLQDMGLLWFIAFLVDQNGEFELCFEELQQKINFKNKSAFQKALKKLVERNWVKKIKRNRYQTERFRVK